MGIKVLKNKLSEYIRLAASGETVLVTDRNRVVAKIVTPDPSRSPSLADAMLAIDERFAGGTNLLDDAATSAVARLA